MTLLPPEQIRLDLRSHASALWWVGLLYRRPKQVEDVGSSLSAWHGATAARPGALSAYYRRLVLDSIEEQLFHQPTVTTRNRKPMQPNPLASWELRVGDLRVYYDVVESPERVVDVLAVGVKEGNTVRIAGKVITL